LVLWIVFLSTPCPPPPFFLVKDPLIFIHCLCFFPYLMLICFYPFLFPPMWCLNAHLSLLAKIKCTMWCFIYFIHFGSFSLILNIFTDPFQFK
jgi:hypothetical protein